MKEILIINPNELKEMSKNNSIYLLTINKIWEITTKYLFWKNEFKKVKEIISKDVSNNLFWLIIEKYEDWKNKLTIKITKLSDIELIISIKKWRKIVLNEKINNFGILSLKDEKKINKLFNFISKKIN